MVCHVKVDGGKGREHEKTPKQKHSLLQVEVWENKLACFLLYVRTTIVLRRGLWTRSIYLFYLTR